MFGYVGASQKDLQSLFSALRGGSACDPHLKKAGIDATCHKNGWGYVLLDSKQLYHYRNERPIYEDTTPLPRCEGPFYAIFHSRYASDQTLNGQIFAHPFVAATNEAVFYFAHNGGVDGGKLPPRVVDSEWALQQIVKHGSVEKALPVLKKKTKPNSALNLLILTIPRAKDARPAIHYLNYFKSTEPGRIGYYQMYSAKMTAGRAVFSSTMADLPIAGAKGVKKTPFEVLSAL